MKCLLIFFNQTNILGPSLPVSLAAGFIVNDPQGGVVHIGGTVKQTFHVTQPMVYRLKDAGLNTKWELLPQTLKNPRHWFVAIPIPDEAVQCS